MKNMTDKQYGLAAVALRRAINEIGGVTATADVVGISQQSVNAWTVCPSHRVIEISKASGVPKSDLRPDLFREDV